VLCTAHLAPASRAQAFGRALKGPERGRWVPHENHDDTHQSTRIGCLHERRSYSRAHTTPGSNVDTPIAGDTTRSRMASEVLSLGPERHL